MTPEQRFRLEQAKNNTPSTSAFILWLPAFVFIAWMCHSDLPDKTAHSESAQSVNVLRWLGVI